MVGDEFNDAMILAWADNSLSIGTRTNVATESADAPLLLSLSLLCSAPQNFLRQPGLWRDGTLDEDDILPEFK